MPKQFLPMTAECSMLQLAAQRAADAARFSSLLVVADKRHAALIEQQLGAINATPQALILEPVGRNTAPAIALAALYAKASTGGQTPLLIMPSDHEIGDVAAFHDAIERALPMVQQGWLATFGIVPDAPETGYGWINQADCIAPGVFRVAKFIEKPPLEQARAMLAQGAHFWNGGIFLFRADAYLSALAAHAPDILAACQRAMANARHDGARLLPDPESFAVSPAGSVDYAIMEKAEHVAVVPVAMGWSDVGSWDALHALGTGDAAGNVCTGNVVTVDSTNCFVRSDNGLRIAMIGVTDMIVVASGNDVLILPRGRSQDVKKLLDAMNG